VKRGWAFAIILVFNLAVEPVNHDKLVVHRPNLDKLGGIGPDAQQADA
jgi:hypothetical protein